MAVWCLGDHVALERPAVVAVFAPHRCGAPTIRWIILRHGAGSGNSHRHIAPKFRIFCRSGHDIPHFTDYTNCTKPFFRTFLYTLLTICQARFFQLFPKKLNVKVHKCYKSVTEALKKHKCTFLEVYWGFFADFREVFKKMNVHVHLGGKGAETPGGHGADVRERNPSRPRRSSSTLRASFFL